jgi:polyphosphate glucokinase
MSLGGPGPVVAGRPAAEPRNLGRGRVRFDDAWAFGQPVRIVNDAAMRAPGAYDGGRMLFLGLGTRLGTVMVVDDVLVPMELAHLPWRCGRTCKDEVGAAGLARLGPAAWKHAVDGMAATLSRALLPDDVVVRGGNVHGLATLPCAARRRANDDAFERRRALWAEPHAARVTLGKEGTCSVRAGSR